MRVLLHTLALVPHLLALSALAAAAPLNHLTLVSVGATNDGGYASAVTVVGNCAYLANAAEGLCTYDISNPTHPIRVAQATNTGLALGVTVRSNLLYLACDHEGLHIYDISNPTSPVHLAQATNDDVIPHSTAVAMLGNYAFLANANSGLWVCDISSPASPIVVCQTTTNGGLFHGSEEHTSELQSLRHL